MTLHDLPRWMLNWLLPGLPWMWLVVSALGVALLIAAGRRRQTLVPTCPVCKYDMRGSPGLSCPECGHTVSQRDQFFSRPRPKWAIVLSVLMIICGPYVDLVQYRFVAGETLQQAVVPNTVWIVGYPLFPTSANEAIDVRIRRWELRTYGQSFIGQYPLPRSHILRYVYGQDHNRPRTYLPVADWQIRLLARHSQRWLTERLAAGYNGMKYTYRPYYYLMLAEQYTDDAYAREQIIAGLTNSDSTVWSTCYKSVAQFHDRAAPYVPHLSHLLRQEHIGWRQLSTFHPVGRYPGKRELMIDRSGSLKYLEIAIGRSGEPAIEVASRWLMEDDERLRGSAVRILSYADVQYDLAQPLADRVVDELISMRVDSQYHNLIGHLGTSAAKHARFYLNSESSKQRFHAVRMLGSIYFDGPERRADRAVHLDYGSREDLRDEWITRVKDPSYKETLIDIARIASEDPDELARRNAERFLEYNQLIGTVSLRRNLYQQPTGKGRHYQYNSF